MIVGLDCAEPSLVLERWKDELPTLSGLMGRGAHGRLTSVIPPITVPAWSCMMASKTPEPVSHSNPSPASTPPFVHTSVV